MPSNNTLDTHTAIARENTSDLSKQIVFAAQPFGTAAEQQHILDQLSQSKVRGTPEFTHFLDTVYKKQNLSEKQKANYCLKTLVKFIQGLAIPKLADGTEDSESTVAQLKENLPKLIQGIDKNSGVLVTLVKQIEEICFIITQSTTIPLEDRLQILYSLYDPIAECAPGIQGQITAVHLYLTANNLLQRLGNFAKSALYELNRNVANTQFDAGPHALNKDLIYAYQHGMRILDVGELVRLGDPYGDRHHTEDINAILAKEFTVEKFLESSVTEVVSNIIGNIQLVYSLFDLGLDFTRNDQETKHKQHVLESSLAYLGIDIQHAEDINNLFSTPLLSEYAIFDLLKEIDKLSAEFDDLQFGTLANLPDATCVIEVHEGKILIWYKEDPKMPHKMIFGIPREIDLYDKVIELSKNKSRIDDLIGIISPKTKSGDTSIQLNQEFIKYMTLKKLVDDRMLGTVQEQTYNILEDRAHVTEYKSKTLHITDDLSIWLAPLSTTTYIFFERKGKFINNSALSASEFTLVKNKLLDLLEAMEDTDKSKLLISLLPLGIFNSTPNSSSEELDYHNHIAKRIIYDMLTGNKILPAEHLKYIQRMFLSQEEMLECIKAATFYTYMNYPNNFDTIIYRIDFFSKDISSNLKKELYTRLLNDDPAQFLNIISNTQRKQELDLMFKDNAKYTNLMLYNIIKNQLADIAAMQLYGYESKAEKKAFKDKLLDLYKQINNSPTAQENPQVIFKIFQNAIAGKNSRHIHYMAFVESIGDDREVATELKSDLSDLFYNSLNDNIIDEDNYGEIAHNHSTVLALVEYIRQRRDVDKVKMKNLIANAYANNYNFFALQLETLLLKHPEILQPQQIGFFKRTWQNTNRIDWQITSIVGAFMSALLFGAYVIGIVMSPTIQAYARFGLTADSFGATMTILANALIGIPLLSYGLPSLIYFAYTAISPSNPGFLTRVISSFNKENVSRFLDISIALLITSAITYTVGMLASSAVRSYFTFGLATTQQALGIQLIFGIIGIPVLSFASAFIGMFVYKAIPVIKKNIAARNMRNLLYKYKDSALVNIIMNENNQRLEDFLQQNNVSKNELQDAKKLAVFINKPVAAQLLEARLLQTPSPSWQDYLSAPFVAAKNFFVNAFSYFNPKHSSVEITMEAMMQPLATNEFKCNDIQLRERIIGSFVAREQAIKIMLEDAKKVIDKKDKAQVTERIAEELHSLNADWKKFLMQTDNQQLLSLASTYAHERESKCVELTKKNLLLMRNYADAVSKEQDVLHALDKTANNRVVRPS
jgi:hypothetical protein